MGGGRQTERGGVEEAKKAWLRRERLPMPVCWPGEFHGWYSPWGRIELDMTEQLSHTGFCQAMCGRGTLSLLHFLLGTPRDCHARSMAEISRGARGTQSPCPQFWVCVITPAPHPGSEPSRRGLSSHPSPHPPRTW